MIALVYPGLTVPLSMAFVRSIVLTYAENLVPFFGPLPKLANKFLKVWLRSSLRDRVLTPCSLHAVSVADMG